MPAIVCVWRIMIDTQAHRYIERSWSRELYLHVETVTRYVLNVQSRHSNIDGRMKRSFKTFYTHRVFIYDPDSSPTSTPMLPVFRRIVRLSTNVTRYLLFILPEPSLLSFKNYLSQAVRPIQLRTRIQPAVLISNILQLLQHWSPTQPTP